MIKRLPKKIRVDLYPIPAAKALEVLQAEQANGREGLTQVIVALEYTLQQRDIAERWIAAQDRADEEEEAKKGTLMEVFREEASL